jgi:hypothetical protein
MTVTVPDEIAEAAQELSKHTGVEPEQLLIKALRIHFPPVPPELQAEFEAWDRASEEDEFRLVIAPAKRIS